ncbi:hypothetical protein [Streptosporangium sp. LJ11]|uniref:hypothetical protein n=1 Tax=Streptosporangium sp. LJ11 TaxID=3436927 RepID=UPI003F78CA9C
MRNGPAPAQHGSAAGALGVLRAMGYEAGAAAGFERARVPGGGVPVGRIATRRRDQPLYETQPYSY